MAPPSRRIAVKDQTGKVGSIDASELESALDAGYERVAPEVLKKAELDAKYGGAGQTALTAVEGAGSGLTFGLSDYAATQVFGDEYRQDALARSEINPFARTGGEIAGALAPLLLTSGASSGASAGTTARTGARALELIGAAPRGVARAAAGAESLVARGLGAESMGARLIAKGAGAAVEGAAYEGAHEFSRATLRDESITGEKLVAAMGRGALMGGAFGVAGAAVGEGKSALGRLLSRAGGTGDDIARSESRAAALVEGAGAADARATTSTALRDSLDVTAGGGTSKVEISGLDMLRGTDPEVARALRSTETRRVALRDATKEADRLGFEAAEARNAASDAVDGLQSGVLRGEAKDRQMARLVDETRAPQAVQQAQDVIDGMKAVVADAIADPTKWPPNVTRKLETIVKNYEGRLLREVEAKEGIAGRMFATLDDLKYDIGGLAKRASGIAGKTLQDDVYNGMMRPALENEAIWGKAAASQRTINPKYAQWIGYERRASQEVEYATGAFKEFDEIYRADPAKYKTAFRQAGQAESYATMQILRDQARAAKELAEAAEQAYQLTPAQREMVASMKGSTEKYERIVKEADDNISLIRKVEEEEAKGGGLASDAAKLLPGVGPAISMMVSTNGVTIARKQEAIANAASRAGAMFVTRLAQWIGASTKAGGKSGGALGMLGGKTTPRLPGGPSARAALPAAMIGTRAQDLVEHRRASLGKLESDPDHAAATYAKALGDLPEVAPKTASAVLATLQRGNQFLLSKLPAPRAQGNQLTPQFGQQPVSRIEAERYARYDRAVHEPATVLDDLARGTLTPEAVEGLRVVHPELYEEMRGVAQEACAQLKNPLPYSQRVRLSLLLDIQGDATQAPEFIMRTQATYAAAEAEAKQPAPQPMPPGSLSRGLQSDISTIEGEALI